MKILFVSPHQLWPPNTGARLRNFHLASALARRCSVTLFQLVQPGEKIVAPRDAGFDRIVSVPKERSYTAKKVIRGLIGPQPLPVLNYSCATAGAELESLLAATDFDTVHLVSIHLLEYLKLVRAAPRGPAVVMDWHNIESELMFRYAAQTRNWARRTVARRTARLLERAERCAIENCHAVTVVSDREKRELAARYGAANIRVIPNGVDSASYKCSHTQSPEPETLLFAGSMNYYANIDAVTWFVREAWPSLAALYPGLTFVIAGSNPTRAVRALASERIRVTGTVDDLRPFYRSATVAIVPVRVGGGTRLKILEAMAAGTPVVSTRVGAEGLLFDNDDAIVLADSAGEMVAAIDRLLKRPEERNRLATQAAALVRRFYDWNAIGRDLYEMHARLSREQVGVSLSIVGAK